MTARLLRPAALAALAALLAPAPAAAQSKAGTTFGSFLLIEPSARFAGMGHAGVALDRGVGGIYYNPASVARIEGWGLELSHGDWLADIRHDHVVAGAPLGRWGRAFASVTALGSGDIEVRTVDQPLGTGQSYAVSDVAIGAGYGLAVSDRFAVGGQLTYVQETIWNSSARTLTLGVGTLYRTSERGLAIGASLAHFGTDAAFDGRDLRIFYDQDPDAAGDNSALPGNAATDRFAVPVLFRVGLGWPLRFGPHWDAALAVDAFHPSDNEESVSLGGELEYRDLVAVRAGWQNLFLAESEAGLALGVGVAGDLDGTLDYRLDYAFADHGRLGAVHRFSLGLLFGERPR